MSEAQLEAYATKRKQIRISNEMVLDYLRKFDPVDEPSATAEQLINFITGLQSMTAVEGKRISQPVYRALSESAQEGLVSDDEAVVNQETGAPNTVYKLLKVPRQARDRNDTWKQRALKAELRCKQLEVARDVVVGQNERLRDRLEALAAGELPL